MEKILLILSFLFLTIPTLNAKDQGTDNINFKGSQKGKYLNQEMVLSNYSDSIIRQKKMKTWYYAYKGKILDNKELKQILSHNIQAFKKFNQSRKTGFISSVLAIGAGLLLAVPVENLMEGHKIDWSPAAFGLGVALVAFPIAILSDHQKDHSVNIYNQGVNSKSTVHRSIKIGLTNSGIAICLKF